MRKQARNLLAAALLTLIALSIPSVRAFADGPGAQYQFSRFLGGDLSANPVFAGRCAALGIASAPSLLLDGRIDGVTTVYPGSAATVQAQGTVTIVNQKTGRKATGTISYSKWGSFNGLATVSWTEQRGLLAFPLSLPTMIGGSAQAPDLDQLPLPGDAFCFFN